MKNPSPGKKKCCYRLFREEMARKCNACSQAHTVSQTCTNTYMYTHAVHSVHTHTHAQSGSVWGARQNSGSEAVGWDWNRWPGEDILLSSLRREHFNMITCLWRTDTHTQTHVYCICKHTDGHPGTDTRTHTHTYIWIDTHRRVFFFFLVVVSSFLCMLCDNTVYIFSTSDRMSRNMSDVQVPSRLVVL